MKFANLHLAEIVFETAEEKRLVTRPVEHFGEFLRKQLSLSEVIGLDVTASIKKLPYGSRMES